MKISQKIGMRIICLFLCFLCVLVLILPAAAATPVLCKEHGLTAVVYRSASSDSSVIGRMSHGESLTVLDSVGEYFKIDCFGMNGYIHKSQIVYTAQSGYSVNCTLSNPDTQVIPTLSYHKAQLQQESVISFSHDLLGVPYVYGGKSPRGFDCSGFVSYVYENHGVSIHRCADDQMQDGMIVAREDLQPGDLVFFSVYGPWLASHVGIYIGDGQMIHAGSRYGICIDSLDNPYWADSYVGARRLTATETDAPELLDTEDSDIPIIAKTGRVNVLFFIL